MIKKRIAVVLVALGAISLAGCGDSKPSEKDGKEGFDKQYAVSQCAIIKSFKKTNGANTDFMGAPAYEMYYEAELKLNKTCFVNYSEQGKHLHSKFTVGIPDWHVNLAEHQVYHAGDTLLVSDKLYLHNTENGWVLLEL
ncbi:hypothetical protein CAP31_02645 [Sulfuriferula sp. AH1]|uniref:hypothetical protein n=1 Tax=Sulfuriferula sp. AH1 TaxID=1985873 RepID=UPI000B3B1915|nr:hypothetical protein [Sulfuriferula sp. AH1]ARU30680.1 hypothetical protein CAP31_02645 [Sulfuriferula sp. AH1]